MYFLKIYKRALFLLLFVALPCISFSKTFTVTSSTSVGLGSLFEKIDSANSLVGADTILFAIGTARINQVIPLTELLPSVTDKVFIDGYSQNESQTAPGITFSGLIQSALVFKEGSEGSQIRGFEFALLTGYTVKIENTASITIKGCSFGTLHFGVYGGLQITNSSDCIIGGEGIGESNVFKKSLTNGVVIEGVKSTNNLILKNYIGVNKDGTDDVGNTEHGIVIQSSANDNILQNNVISGNKKSGIVISGVGANNNIIKGNVIGMSPDGNSLKSNNEYGVFITDGATNNTIGGSTVEDRNLISKNLFDGIFIDRSNNQLIEGNFIGTSTSGLNNFGNNGNGIKIITSNSVTIKNNVISGNSANGVLLEKTVDGCTLLGNIIGGTYPSAVNAIPNSQNGIYIDQNSGNVFPNLIGDGTEAGNNIIAHNLQNGIVVLGFTRNNNIHGNSIHSNSLLGIDLASNGADVRDALDADDGPNRLFNRPLLESIDINGQNATFNVQHIGINNESVRFDFYASVQEDNSGNGEGQFYVGSASVLVTDGMKFSRSFHVPADSRSFSVTATFSNNTSEFSNSVSAVPVPTGNIPKAINDTVQILEDANTTTFYVSKNDSDIDGNLDTMSVKIITPLAKHGSAGKMLGTGAISYTPNANFYGADTIHYEICDKTTPTALCSQAILIIQVISQPDPPVVEGEVVTILQGRDTIINILSNDSDIDNDIDTAGVKVVYKSNKLATYTPLTNGNLTISYSVAPTYKGEDTIRYEVCDKSPVPLCDQGEIVISVLQGASPVIKAVTDSVFEDSGQKTYDLLSLISDADNGLMMDSLKIIKSPSNGVAEIVVGGKLNYTPNKDYFGQQNIQYKACDSTANCTTGQINIFVKGVNDRPVAVNDTATVIHASDALINIANNDFDVDNNLNKSSIKILNIVSATRFLENSLVPGEIQIYYSDKPSLSGKDTLQYEICDLTTPVPLCDTAFAFITLEKGNPPSTQSDSIEVIEDQKGSISVQVLLNDSDVDGNLVVSTLSIKKPFSNNGATVGVEKINIQLTKNFTGLDTLIYSICDFTGFCAEDTLFLKVSPVNDPPIVSVIERSIYQGECPTLGVLLQFNTLLSEPDAGQEIDFSTLSFENGSSSGKTFSSDPLGQIFIQYTDLPLFSGVDSIQYKVADTGGLFDSSYVVINVIKNNAPTLLSDNLTLNTGEMKTVNVLQNDADNTYGIDVKEFKIIKNFTEGIGSIGSGNVIKVDFSNSSFIGKDTLTYELCDSACLCSQTQLYIEVKDTVTVVKDSIRLLDDELTIKAGCVTTSINVFENDHLPSNTLYSTFKLIGPSNPHWKIASSGVITFNFLDTVEVSSFVVNYELCDSVLKCDTGSINVIIGDNAVPKTQSRYYEFVEGESLKREFDVLSTTKDEDGIMKSSLQMVQRSSIGSSFSNVSLGTIDVNYGAITDYSLVDTLIYSICDSLCMCAQDTIFISFKELNEVLVYEGFSPNGDNINDVWEIDYIENHPENTVEVYNRWGNLVFKTTSYHNTLNYWNGTANEGILVDDNSLPEGIYYYIIHLSKSDTKPLKGQVIIQK